jgi:TonB family protein
MIDAIRINAMVFREFWILFVLSGALSAQTTPTPAYRVPSEYAYYTAEQHDLPQYPPEALNKNIQGNVILVVEYSIGGTLVGARGVIGDPLLVKASMQAVTNWKFRKVKEKGEKARGVTYVGFDFIAAERKVAVTFPFGTWEDSGIKSGVTPVHLNPDDLRSVKISGENPRYPESAKHNRVQGQVLLHAVIDREGHICLLEVTKSPSPDLAVASIEAVKTWQYKPYTLNGQPVEIETTITVNYTLRG